MEKRALRDGGESLVYALDTKVSSRSHAVFPVKKVQVRAVRLIHQKFLSPPVKKARDAFCLGKASRVVRRDDQRPIYVLMRIQKRFDLLFCDIGPEGRGAGGEEDRLNPAECQRGKGASVGVCRNEELFARTGRAHQRCDHSCGRSSSQHQAPSRAVYARDLLLHGFDNLLRMMKIVRARDFRDVERERKVLPPSLVSGHMHAHRVFARKFFNSLPKEPFFLHNLPLKKPRAGILLAAWCFYYMLYAPDS